MIVVTSMIAVTSMQRVAVHFDPVGSWLLVALVTVALLAVLLAVPPDRSRVSHGRVLVLVLLRLGAFLALRPSWRAAISTSPPMRSIAN